MSDADSQEKPDPGYVQKNPPSPSRKKKEKDGYAADFYPGFVAGVVVRREGQEDVVVYRQAEDDPFILPAGSDRPFETSEFDFTGGKLARHFRLTITDPHREIDSITVRLKARSERLGDAEGEFEEVMIQDGSVLCPPMCPPIIPGGGGDPGGSGGAG
ncbi:hypothetical protein [Longimicrobium terrae]|uniref:Uncharacterized protein n=1 Tax=Longimicrobium terrae TaxID=1639882 RepID=A0A841H5E8_9BACT|nr:hypothetical protein [Longimicrobium terrae]MBB4639092.1 hypothetical protein [Longimicrobium terrae]MBB6073307.1 hypothetical protein [Longimicrobium terrae]NNC28746.1 hypothetical protein [Longimicrobium terrae]